MQLFLKVQSLVCMCLILLAHLLVDISVLMLLGYRDRCCLEHGCTHKSLFKYLLPSLGAKPRNGVTKLFPDFYLYILPAIPYK